MQTLFIRLMALMLTILLTAPSYAKLKVSHNKQQFINSMLPAIANANASVAKHREALMQLKQQWQTNHSLSKVQKQQLFALANDYKVSTRQWQREKFWQALERRVDVLPASLVLAQAIEESNWGKSRFAKLGNNYFGQWCFQPGCGIVPKRRPAGRSYEVKTYLSKSDSVASYLHNINTHPAYSALRHIRAKERSAAEHLDPVMLAKGLSNYSARRGKYVGELQQLINHYQLTRFDQATEAVA